MSDFNRQFLFEQVVESKPKPTLRQKLAKRTTFLTGTAAIALGAIVGAGVGAGVGVGQLLGSRAPHGNQGRAGAAAGPQSAARGRHQYCGHPPVAYCAFNK